MASTKGRLLDLLGGVVLSEAAVLAVEPVSTAFRLLRLRVDPKLAFQPGDKVQIVLPSRDVRTYTPTRWTAAGECELLVYLHSMDTPGTSWVRGLNTGGSLRFVGPQRSLSLPSGPVVVVGDETSIAVGVAYALARPGQVRLVLEVAPTMDGQVRAAAAALGLTALTVFHRGEAGQVAMLNEIAAAAPTAIGITGGGGLVQRVRDGLQRRGISGVKLKTYWVEGRTGLD